MAPTKIIVQNISGNILDKKTTGKLCTLKVSIHKIRPNIIILTETRHLPEFNGKGIFKGYGLAQSASSGGRAAGVLVFKKTKLKSYRALHTVILEVDTAWVAI